MERSVLMANIKDVAQKAGLSVTTVSRVLNNRGYLSEETRKKVYDAMAELNYQPNELARSLFRQRSNILGVIVPSVEHPFFARLLQSIEGYASQAGFKVMLCISHQNAAKEIEYLQMLRGNKVDGVILSSRSADLRAHLSHSFPFVTVDRILDNQIPCVASDSYQGGCLATQHLIDRGCKRLAHIAGPADLMLQANRRDEAFCDTCAKNGLEPVIVSTTEQNFSAMEYWQPIRDLLNAHDVDGIFASNDIMAAQVIRVAAEQGRAVPEMLKVVGFDDIPLASLTNPAITTVRQPVEEIGKYAVEIIAGQLAGKTVPVRTVLPVTLVPRQTT